MLLDFNHMPEESFPHFKNGDGSLEGKMFFDGTNRILHGRLTPGSSIGLHKHETSDEVNYVLSGTGKAICDGKEESLAPGTCHICKKGSEHSIVNTVEEDLVLLTVVIER